MWLARRRAEAKRKEVEARKFKETASQRQETLEEKRQKKAEEEAVSGSAPALLPAIQLLSRHTMFSLTQVTDDGGE